MNLFGDVIAWVFDRPFLLLVVFVGLLLSQVISLAMVGRIPRPRRTPPRPLGRREWHRIERDILAYRDSDRILRYLDDRLDAARQHHFPQAS